MDSTNKYGRIYHEICNGFSKQELNNSEFYFKHPTLSDHFSYYCNYDVYFNEGRRKGLLTEEEKIKDAIVGGWWSSQKESTVSLLKLTIKNLMKTQAKLALPSQKKDIQSQIKRNEAILLSYEKERNEIVGYTLENYSNLQLMEDLLINFIYKDKEFKHKLFEDKNDYDSLSEGEIKDLKILFNAYSAVFTAQNLKCVAACGFFQNLVYLNEDAQSFWGKPAVQCSRYQIDLLLYGKMYRNFIKNRAENNKPVNDEIISDPEAFVEFVDNQSGNSSSRMEKGSSSNNAVSSYVGATSDDLNQMGVKIEKLKGKSLLQLAEESGGTLEKSDYLKAREGV